MLIKGNTEQLYDMIVKLYNATFEDQNNFTIQLEILPTVNTVLLNDFLELVQDAIDDFKINVEFEVIDNAEVL